jgi:hypothetical protein
MHPKNRLLPPPPLPHPRPQHTHLAVLGSIDGLCDLVTDAVVQLLDLQDTSAHNSGTHNSSGMSAVPECYPR